MFTCQLAIHQNSLGHNIKIASIYPGNAALPWDDEILCMQGSESKKIIDYKGWRNIFRLIKQFNPDLIQANSGDTLKYLVFSKKIFGWQTPIVFRNASEIGRYIKSPIQKKINNYFYKNVDFVISVSKASEKDILRLFPFLIGKTEVIPVGLENISIEEIILQPVDFMHIVHVGGFSFEKNHIGLLKIFKKVSESNSSVHLHLVGDGPLKTKVVKEIEKLDLKNNVSLYGFVKNPLSYIKAANILILPSIIEGLPGVLLEAMYSKTPVIAYDVGGISEILNFETGNLIKKNDEMGFSKSILNTLQTPPVEQIEKAYNLVTNEYMNYDITKKFIEVYEKVKLNYM